MHAPPHAHACFGVYAAYGVLVGRVVRQLWTPYMLEFPWLDCTYVGVTLWFSYLLPFTTVPFRFADAYTFAFVVFLPIRWTMPILYTHRTTPRAHTHTVSPHTTNSPLHHSGCGLPATTGPTYSTGFFSPTPLVTTRCHQLIVLIL